MVRFMPCTASGARPASVPAISSSFAVESLGGDEVVEEAEGEQRLGVEGLGEQEQAAGGLAARRSMARAMPAGS